ncbi:MAG: DUF6285 domain-containing protein [Spirochaetaceae bacterium]|nr:DUF6285 domain-containing protein [Spirochaetaceae bacterium]
MASSRPTIDELLEATQEFLEKRIIDKVDSNRAFHTRVAINVLALVRRELQLGTDLADKEKERLHSLLGTDGTIAEMNAELCSRLRDKSMDYRNDEIFRHLFETTMGQVSIDNPEYSGYKRALEESSDM